MILALPTRETPSTPTVLDAPRMARALRVTVKWLNDAADRGEIPFLAAGTRKLFNPVAVNAALAKQAARMPRLCAAAKK